MTLGQGGWTRSSWRSGWWLCLLAGCAAGKGTADSTVQSSRTPAVTVRAVSDHYQVSCPDRLEINVGPSPPLEIRVRVDGRINLGALGEVRVEGLTCGEIEHRLAAKAHLPDAAVHAQVEEFRSQQIYIFGEVNGLQRAVPYQGQETVLELLRRAGGLSEGAEPDDVTVVRTHVADGRQPELFPIHLNASAGDARAGLKLEPFDQVYIGETRRSSIRKLLPPWLRPLYESLTGMKLVKK
jgi:protein involved in polysaccharide export with SLBB domain